MWFPAYGHAGIAASPRKNAVFAVYFEGLYLELTEQVGEGDAMTNGIGHVDTVIGLAAVGMETADVI
jgi:hypothetical protein